MRVLGSKDTNVRLSTAKKGYKIEKVKSNDIKKKLARKSFEDVDINSASDLDKENIGDPWFEFPSDAESVTHTVELKTLPSPNLLSKQALEQAQFNLCEREMEATPCSHPFCEKLRAVKLSLPEFRNLLLFDFEMIPKQFQSDMINLRNGCYRQKVYCGLWSDWKLPPNDSEKSELYPDFPKHQLFIGDSLPAKLSSAVASFPNSDRVRSRRLIMPRSLLARRNQVTDFDEPFDPSELLRDSSSLSLSTDEQQIDTHHFEHNKDVRNRHSRLACLLSKELRKN
ncbi:LAFA_0D05446g1_1 [Lachancea sp. 'fantastica']|nr:LAFA_0D05446g1_1 [Lachancea sp. 'fantastica']